MGPRYFAVDPAPLPNVAAILEATQMLESQGLAHKALRILSELVEYQPESAQRWLLYGAELENRGIFPQYCEAYREAEALTDQSHAPAACQHR